MDLFERMLICCRAKESKLRHYSLVTSAQLPKLQFKRRIFTKDIVCVVSVPFEEDAILRILWRNTEVLESLTFFLMI